jgi:hypothetical protein
MALMLQLEELQRRHRELTTKTLPEQMDEIGVSSFALANGAKVEVNSIVQGSIPSPSGIKKAKGEERQALIKRREGCFAWLKDKGHGDLIKHEIALTFGRDSDEEVTKVKTLLDGAGFRYSDEEMVAPQTLGAFIREQIASGVDIPSDLFGLYTGKLAKIVRPDDKAPKGGKKGK